MPKHSNALGYLYDLAQEVNEPWFTMICDLAGAEGVSALDLPTREILLALYTSKASYLRMKSAAPSSAVAPTASAPDFLEELSGFTNFKLLGDTLRVGLQKRITLIFGANGTGKSSLCESLKVLATTELPNRPLHNVRGTGTASPTFRYKFKSDAAAQTWNQAHGYGPRQAIVKYFDTGIAVKNIESPVEPGRIIVLTPFKLHVFEWATALTMRFREALQQVEQENLGELTSALTSIRLEFAKFKGRPLSAIVDRTETFNVYSYRRLSAIHKTLAELPDQIKLGEDFTEDKVLDEKLARATQLEKAASEEGLRLLKAERRDLEALLNSLGTLIESARTLWSLQPVVKAATLAVKQREQEKLAKLLIPDGETLERLLKLLHAASPLCTFEAAEGQACPLCKRDLGAPEVELFKLYHDLLADDLEKEISVLKADIAMAEELATAIRRIDRREWDKSTTLPTDILSPAKAASELIVACCNEAKEMSGEAQAAFGTVIDLLTAGAQQLKLKSAAIDSATKGKEEVANQLAVLRADIETMEYARCIRGTLTRLREAERLASEAAFWDEKLPAFTPLLKKITDTAKKAHEELIVADFEKRLNAEYQALTEKDMAAFGVMLIRKGTEASVTVLPQIGGKEIGGVLSEGEQRVHALALFFAELETCPQSVMVFDDPVSSFDYNYIANYCIRLRDFALAHPTRQIILLTHNWEFFIQIQTTLNSCGLNAQLSVQVLENCTVVADYSEKADELKTAISAILAISSEPTKAQKEEMAGKMRRLIEAVVNTHVFNKQRHQYKQKSQPISEFQKFTKLVPLLPTEATILRDLYAKLSTTEHDDPTTAYVNTDKAAFQTRYDRILAVEAAVISRK